MLTQEQKNIIERYLHDLRNGNENIKLRTQDLTNISFDLFYDFMAREKAKGIEHTAEELNGIFKDLSKNFIDTMKTYTAYSMFTLPENSENFGLSEEGINGYINHALSKDGEKLAKHELFKNVLYGAKVTPEEEQAALEGSTFADIDRYAVSSYNRLFNVKHRSTTAWNALKSDYPEEYKQERLGAATLEKKLLIRSVNAIDLMNKKVKNAGFFDILFHLPSYFAAKKQVKEYKQRLVEKGMNVKDLDDILSGNAEVKDRVIKAAEKDFLDSKTTTYDEAELAKGQSKAKSMLDKFAKIEKDANKEKEELSQEEKNIKTEKTIRAMDKKIAETKDEHVRFSENSKENKNIKLSRLIDSYSREIVDQKALLEQQQEKTNALREEKEQKSPIWNKAKEDYEEFGKKIPNFADKKARAEYFKDKPEEKKIYEDLRAKRDQAKIEHDSLNNSIKESKTKEEECTKAINSCETKIEEAYREQVNPKAKSNDDLTEDQLKEIEELKESKGKVFESIEEVEEENEEIEETETKEDFYKQLRESTKENVVKYVDEVKEVEKEDPQKNLDK